MADAFKKGDLVQLKSGGPAMTVESVPSEYVSKIIREPQGYYRCVWFRGATQESGHFKEHLLQAYSPPSTK